MTTATIKKAQVDALIALLGDTSSKIKKELRIAINQTAKKERLEIGRVVRQHMAFSKTGVEKEIKVKRQASEESLTASVEVQRGRRISLKELGVRKAGNGISYKTAPKQKRARLGPPDANTFIWRGHGFKRFGSKVLPSKGRYSFYTSLGIEHLPTLRQRITRLDAASPWGVFTGARGKHTQGSRDSLLPATLIDVEAELQKKIQQRINYLMHKAAGTLRGKQRT